MLRRTRKCFGYRHDSRPSGAALAKIREEGLRSGTFIYFIGKEEKKKDPRELLRLLRADIKDYLRKNPEAAFMMVRGEPVDRIRAEAAKGRQSRDWDRESYLFTEGREGPAWDKPLPVRTVLRGERINQSAQAVVQLGAAEERRLAGRWSSLPEARRKHLKKEEWLLDRKTNIVASRLLRRMFRGKKPATA